MHHLKQEEFHILLKHHQLYVNSLGEKGARIRLNKTDISKLQINDGSLSDSFITESIFQDTCFENIEIFDANFCGCMFSNVMFINANFVKTDLSYCIFTNCKFIHTNLKRCETNQTTFESCQFISCELYDSLSYAALKDILFCDMSLKNTDFYKTGVSKVSLRNVRDFDLKKSIKSINIGGFKNESILTGEKAIGYFQKICIYE